MTPAEFRDVLRTPPGGAAAHQGGMVKELKVAAGDGVTAGQPLGVVA